MFSLMEFLLPGPFPGDATLSKRRLLDHGVLLKVQTALRLGRSRNTKTARCQLFAFAHFAHSHDLECLGKFRASGT